MITASAPAFGTTRAGGVPLASGPIHFNRGPPMKQTAGYGNVVSYGPFRAVRELPEFHWHRISVWHFNIWRHPQTGKLLFWRWG